MYSQKFNSLKDVDKFGSPPSYSIYPTIGSYPFLYSLEEMWKYENISMGIKNYDQRREKLKWIISKCLQIIILKEFDICLRHANKYVLFNQRIKFNEIRKEINKGMYDIIINYEDNEIYAKNTSYQDRALTYNKLCINNSKSVK
ncbi:hypothetical protein ACLIA0_11975 [Bacillaceae bacterium W0354]